MWEELLSLLSSAGQGISEGAGNLWEGVLGVGGQAAQGAANLGGNLWQGIQSNPWGAIGAGIQGAGSLAPMFMGGQPDQSFAGAGLQAQMQQPQGPSQQQIKSRLATAQAQGLSGASPDFLAQLNGVTPDELNQMLGLGQRGGVQG